MTARPWPGDASPAEITRAFRRLARSRHPDVTGEATEREHRRIREAYERLTHDGPPPGGTARPPSRGVRTRVPVSCPELVLGARVPLRVPGHGTVPLHVPAGLGPQARRAVGALARHLPQPRGDQRR